MEAKAAADWVRNDFGRLQFVSSDKHRTSTHERWRVTSIVESVARRMGPRGCGHRLERDRSSLMAYRKIAAELAHRLGTARPCELPSTGRTSYPSNASVRPRLGAPAPLGYA
jgi:hypothetical protein